MENYEESVKLNPNSYWSYIPNYRYRTLIIGDSGSGKTNTLLNLIKLQQPNIDKIICTSVIYSNQSILCLSMEEKM